MPVHCYGRLPLSAARLAQLWAHSRLALGNQDQVVTIRSLSEVTMRSLNRRWRQLDAPTNVLTFSYPGEHDVAICLPYIKREAKQQGKDLSSYLAWILVHAFVHVAGLDHERSAATARRVAKIEQEILQVAGYSQ